MVVSGHTKFCGVSNTSLLFHYNFEGKKEGNSPEITEMKVQYNIVNA
jgi:hypothetical protein